MVSGENKKVSDLLAKRGNKEIYFIYYQSPIDYAAETMRHYRVRAIGVLDIENKLVGILSESDLTNKVVALDRVPKNCKVSEVITPLPLICVEPDTFLQACAQLMQEKAVQHLAVTNDKRMTINSSALYQSRIY